MVEQQPSYRSRLDIIANIIEMSIDGVGPTRLIYGCNMSYFQFKNYIDTLTLEGFLEKKLSKGNRKRCETYHATLKGIEFVNDYTKLKKVLQE